MKCDKCDARAIILQRYSGMHLCEKHFQEDVERKIKRAMRRFKMIERGDRIAVAISGGKDSSVLLYTLHLILGERPDIELIAFTIDEGIKDYRCHTVPLAKKLAKDLGVEHVIIPFKEEYGVELDELIKGKVESPCTYCGVLRKTAMNRFAKRIGATKVATGHNLDDEAQTVLMNYFRGDVDRLIRLQPVRRQPGLVPRIKPMRDVPEKEVALYAIVRGLEVDFNECPYSHEALRFEVRDILNDMETGHPGTKYAILRGYDKLMELIGGRYEQPTLERCRICKEPAAGEVCMACQLLER